MHTILKYPLEIEDVQSIQAYNMSPTTRGKAVMVGLDLEGRPCIWMAGDTDAQRGEFKIFMQMTGASFHPDLVSDGGQLKGQYIGTLTYLEHLWHVFIL